LRCSHGGKHLKNYTNNGSFERFAQHTYIIVRSRAWASGVLAYICTEKYTDLENRVLTTLDTVVFLQTWVFFVITNTANFTSFATFVRLGVDTFLDMCKTIYTQHNTLKVLH